MKLLLTKGVSDQTSTIMIIVQVGNLSLSLFASFNVLAEHTSELFLNVAAENMLNKILKYCPRFFQPIHLSVIAKDVGWRRQW